MAKYTSCLLSFYLPASFVSLHCLFVELTLCYLHLGWHWLSCQPNYLGPRGKLLFFCVTVPLAVFSRHWNFWTGQEKVTKETHWMCTFLRGHFRKWQADEEGFYHFQTCVSWGQAKPHLTVPGHVQQFDMRNCAQHCSHHIDHITVSEARTGIRSADGDFVASLEAVWQNNVNLMSHWL